MNIVFGIIIDTFSDLRSQRDEKTRNMQTVVLFVVLDETDSTRRERQTLKLTLNLSTINGTTSST